MSSVPPLAAHWIDGRPVEGDHAFDVAAADGTPLWRYPRAGADEAARALDAALRSGPAWCARTARERDGLLARAVGRLGAADGEAAALWAALGARVGLDAGELDRVRAEAVRAAERASREATGAAPRAPTLVAAHWSELVAGVVRRAFAALARGAPVVLVPDARAPMAAELVAAALVDAGIDAGAVALLHDDVDRVVRELVADPRGVRIVVGAPAAELARRFPGRRAHAPVAEAAPDGPDGPSPAAADLPFGAGLGLADRGAPRAHGTRFDAVPLVAGTHVVGDDEDPAEAARRVVRGALSRLPALSGQAPGQTGRVLVPERRFSRFSEALLEHLETDSDLLRPLPAIDRDEVRERRRARALGVDEGATLIWSGAPRTADTAGETAPEGLAAPSDGGGSARAEHAARSRATDGRASLMASVFTNVERGGRLYDLSRPLPLLRLVRVGNEAEGRLIAGRLDAPDTDPEGTP